MPLIINPIVYNATNYEYPLTTPQLIVTISHDFFLPQDIACVHQTDPELRERGVYGIGGWLSVSRWAEEWGNIR